MLSYQAVSPMMVYISVNNRTSVQNIVQVYAPDSYYRDIQHQYFMDMLQLNTSVTIS